jgi:hypothetical protein
MKVSTNLLDFSLLTAFPLMLSAFLLAVDYLAVKGTALQIQHVSLINDLL